MQGEERNGRPRAGISGAEGSCTGRALLTTRKCFHRGRAMAGRLSREEWPHAVGKLWSLGDRPGSKSQLHHLLAGGPRASSLTSPSLGFLLHKMEIIQAPTSNDLYRPQ